MILPNPLAAVLFDLDGTLVDSAADLVAALNSLRAELGLESVPEATIRDVVSRGGRAMLRRGFPDADDARIDVLLPRFLDIYARDIAVHTHLYEGMDEVLKSFEARGIAWGIVTNKPGWLARPLVDALGLASRCAALVSGDCLPTRKPDPAPVLHACALAGVDARATAFVGDDERDIVAGRDAGTFTIAASYGYLDGGDPASWRPDAIAHSPSELPRVLGLA